MIEDNEYEQRKEYVKNLDIHTKYVSLKKGEKYSTNIQGASKDIPWSENWGIVRNDMYVVLDFDKDTHQRFKVEDMSFPTTWCQETPRTDCRGMHYLFTLPSKLKGVKLPDAVKFYDPEGKALGEILTGGALPGPGSIVDGRPYKLVNNSAPVLAPEWVVTLILEASKGIKKDSSKSDEFDMVMDGQGRDAFVHKILSTARKAGLSEKGLYALGNGILNSGIIEQPEGEEKTEEDVERIARSVTRYRTEIDPSFTVKTSQWRSASDLPANQPNIEWILHRFIPQYKLTFQYGKGGIGKSSWVPWLVGKLLGEGLKVGFSATEETFERFSNAVRLSTKNFSFDLFKNLYDLDNDWMFPRDENKLREGLSKCPLDFIYFDSIYDIFDPKGAGIFTNTRQCLKPLSIICQDCNVTILGTFHENKSGTFNGSKEMESIPRSLIHATEHEGRLRLHVEKSNNRKPEYDLLSVGSWVPESNADGSIVKERNEDGQLVNSEIYIVEGFEKIECGVDVENGVKVEDLIPDTSDDEAFWKVYTCKKENPAWGRQRISEQTGLSVRIVQVRLEKMGIKEDLT